MQCILLDNKDFNLQLQSYTHDYINMIAGFDDVYGFKANEANALLTKAMHYSVVGGKALRARMFYLMANILKTGISDNLYFSIASSIEMAHAYTLIHDDLPCMDDDDFRRGKPSCHKEFGESTALLAGNSLMNLSIKTIANLDVLDAIKLRLIKSLTSVMSHFGILAGQVLDLSEDIMPSEDIINQIIYLKTVCFFELCAEFAISLLACSGENNSNNDNSDILLKFAREFGYAYQIKDDIDDLETIHPKGEKSLLRVMSLEAVVARKNQYKAKALEYLNKLEIEQQSAAAKEAQQELVKMVDRL